MGLFSAFKKVIGLEDKATVTVDPSVNELLVGASNAPAPHPMLYGQPPLAVLEKAAVIESAEAWAKGMNGSEPGAAPRAEVGIRFNPSLVGAKGAANSDVVFILDASASMHGEYRSGRVEEVVWRVLQPVLKYDDDGVDFIAHSYGSGLQPKYFGKLITRTQVQKMCQDILRNLGGGTKAQPAMEAAEQYQKANGCLNVILITDGAFGDKREVINKIRDWADKAYAANRPGLYHVHIVGIGSDLDESYLVELDEGLGTKLDIVSFSHEEDALNAPAAIVNELEQTFVSVGEEGEIVVTATGANVVRVGNLKANSYNKGNTYFGFENLPVQMSIGIEFDREPSDFTVTLVSDKGEWDVKFEVK